MPHATPTGTRHEIFALTHGGMHQGDIAARVGVARKTPNLILLRQAATASLEPGKSTEQLLERPQPVKNAHSS